MKIKNLILLGFLFNLSAFAQTNTTISNPSLLGSFPPLDINGNLVMVLVSSLTPVALAVIKKWIPKLENDHPHLIPVLAPFVGVGISELINLISTQHISGVAGGALGLMGVGLREIYTQNRALWQAPGVDPAPAVASNIPLPSLGSLGVPLNPPPPSPPNVTATPSNQPVSISPPVVTVTQPPTT